MPVQLMSTVFRTPPRSGELGPQAEWLLGPQDWRWLAPREPSGLDIWGFPAAVDDIRHIGGVDQRCIIFQSFGCHPKHTRLFGKTGHEWETDAFALQFDEWWDVAFVRPGEGSGDRTDDRSYGKGGGKGPNLEDTRAWGCLPSSCNSLIFIC